jgi:hypothetical protein
MATAEDVIIWKLRWARAKDLEDVKAIMAVQREKLDWHYIESWCSRHETLAVLRSIRNNVV